MSVTCLLVALLLSSWTCYEYEWPTGLRLQGISCLENGGWNGHAFKLMPWKTCAWKNSVFKYCSVQTMLYNITKLSTCSTNCWFNWLAICVSKMLTEFIYSVQWSVIWQSAMPLGRLLIAGATVYLCVNHMFSMLVARQTYTAVLIGNELIMSLPGFLYHFVGKCECKQNGDCRSAEHEWTPSAERVRVTRSICKQKLENRDDC